MVPPDGDPVWWGRAQDVQGALRTVYMNADRILGYPDIYVQSSERHPMQVLAAQLAERGWGKGVIGVEMDNYWFSAAAFATLQRELPNARFIDTTGLVNWQRAVKSPRELDYMRIAGQHRLGHAQIHRRCGRTGRAQVRPRRRHHRRRHSAASTASAATIRRSCR